MLAIQELLHQRVRRYEATASLDAADTLHVATALNRNIDTIIGPDTAFDAVPGLRRFDPVTGRRTALTPRL